MRSARARKLLGDPSRRRARSASPTFINIPNDGTLSTVGALGVNTTTSVGFDISGADAFATLTGTGTTFSTLYRVTIATGAATVIGNIGGAAQLRGIAIAP